MQKDFITATPDSGGSGSTTVTATAPANQTESARSVNLSVAGGGMTRTVAAIQAAGVVTWNYYFSVTPTSLSFVAGGESKSVTVTSYRKKVINGVETSTQENVNYTVAVTGTGFSGSGTTVTAAANSAMLTRTGTATYTQATSGKSQEVFLSQAAAAPITVSPTDVFSNMTRPDIGQSYATTITVSNCPTKPTVSITMEEELDNGPKHQIGKAGNSEPVSTGNNTWTFKVWPEAWYLATNNTGIVIPGWYCLGEVTVTLTIKNSATVSIRGYVPIDF
jgi:hypothetical protein